jgi:hypothetical protein
MLSRYSPPLPLRALLDDSAHLATVALILLAVPRRLPRSFWIGGLLGSVVLDVDQVPQVFGIYWPPVVGRPYPHSLLAVLLVTLVLCRLVPGNQALVFGLACGLLSHLARDVATGLTPVFWPLMISQVAVPYAVYAAGIAVTTGWVAYREVAQGPDRAARSVLSQIRPQRG